MVKSRTVSKYNILSNLEFSTGTHYYRIYSLQSQVRERNKKCLSWKAKGMSFGQKLLAEDLNSTPFGCLEPSEAVMHSSTKITNETYSNLDDGEVQNRITKLTSKAEPAQASDLETVLELLKQLLEEQKKRS